MAPNDPIYPPFKPLSGNFAADATILDVLSPNRKLPDYFSVARDPGTIAKATRRTNLRLADYTAKSRRFVNLARAIDLRWAGLPIFFNQERLGLHGGDVPVLAGQLPRRTAAA